jgi:hypothetical protein
MSFVASMRVLATTGTAAAQTHRERRARQRYAQGLELYELGEYSAALALFEASYALVPQPVVLVNVAITQRELGRYDEAAGSLRRYLSSADVRESDRERIRSEIRQLEASVGSVRISLVPEDANLLIDGRLTEERELLLSAGSHQIMGRRDGYRDATAAIDVVPGRPIETMLRLRQSEAMGVLVIEASPGGAAVEIDGDPVGYVPLTRDLSTGGHAVRLTLDGYEPEQREVVVNRGQRTTLALELDPQRALYERWWFWTIIVAVVAGISVGLGVGLYEPERAPSGTLF